MGVVMVLLMTSWPWVVKQNHVRITAPFPAVFSVAGWNRVKSRLRLNRKRKLLIFF